MATPAVSTAGSTDTDTGSPEADGWVRNGYTSAAATEWLAARVLDPCHADAWRALGFTPRTAAPWVVLELLPAEAATIAAARLTPDYVRRVRAADLHDPTRCVDPPQAAVAPGAGLDL